MIGRGLAPLLVCALAAPVHAQPEPSADSNDVEASSKALYDAGSKAYEAHEYATAIDDFRKAYALLPEPLFLFDIAQSYRQIHDCDNARSFYRSYLRNAPDAENKDKAQRFLDEMEQCVRDAQAHAPPNTGTTTTVTTTPGGEQAASDKRAQLRFAGLVTGIGGLVLVGVGVAFSIEAADAASNLELECMQRCTAGDALNIDQAGRNDEAGAVITYVLGGAAIAVGVGLYLYAREPAPVVVVPTPGGAAVSTMVRF